MVTGGLLKSFRSWSGIVLGLVLVYSSAGWSQATAVKEWTFLVYMNADNNLYDFASLNFSQMEKVGSSDQVNVVVQLDPEPTGMPTTRYLVTKNANAVKGTITSKPLQTLGELIWAMLKLLLTF
jgi:hypothetical protein